jgi:hypothetical protein
MKVKASRVGFLALVGVGRVAQSRVGVDRRVPCCDALFGLSEWFRLSVLATG